MRSPSSFVYKAVLVGAVICAAITAVSKIPIFSLSSHGEERLPALILELVLDAIKYLLDVYGSDAFVLVVVAIITIFVLYQIHSSRRDSSSDAVAIHAIDAMADVSKSAINYAGEVFRDATDSPSVRTKSNGETARDGGVAGSPITNETIDAPRISGGGPRDAANASPASSVADGGSPEDNAKIDVCVRLNNNRRSSTLLYSSVDKPEE